MNVNPPTLKKLADGRWATRWGGRRHYFGRDPTIAAQRYAESMRIWSDWQANKAEARIPPRATAFLVVDLVGQFLDGKEAEGGSSLRDYYARHLKRFLVANSGVKARTMRATDVQALRDGMLATGYARKTVNHDVVATKAMLTWGMDRELIPMTNLKACKQLRLDPPKDKSMSRQAVLAMIHGAPEPQQSWLAVNYLTACRPIEVVRIVHGDGKWIEEGVFRMVSKRIERHVVFSPLALSWFPRCRPVWKRLDSYSSAVRRVCGAGGPHALRHSAATHLHQLGATRADVDLILGHMPGRVSMIYARIVWQPLRATASLLTL